MQKPQLVVISYHHKNTDIEFRDQVSLNTAMISAFIKAVQEENSPLDELAVLSTCNRTEFYCVTKKLESIQGWLLSHYRKIRQYHFPQDAPRAMVLFGTDADKHLLRVAAGMESMVLGENQILSQVKSCYEKILSSGYRFPLLSKLFQYAIKAGKIVRSETSLCRGAVSVSLAAVELSRKIFTHFAKHKILLIGAGETSQLVATHFCSFGGKQFIIANRSWEKAQIMAEKFAAETIALEGIGEVLHEVDIVVAATNSANYLVTMEQVKRALSVRTRPFLMLDISTPRNIAPEIKDIGEVYLYNIDDLKGVVAANLAKREVEIPAAQAIVEKVAREFSKWLKSLEVVPTITKLAHHFDEIRAEELKKFFHKVDEVEYQRLEILSKKITNKLLHYPISSLHKMNNGEELDVAKLHFICEIYRLYEEQL